MSIVKIYGTGRAGFLIMSDDTGNTWTELSPPAFRVSDTPVVAVNPQNGDKIIMAGIKNNDADPVIYYSYDGGITFDEAICEFILNSFSSTPQVQIIDKYNAYVVCESGLYRSSDQYVNFSVVVDFNDTSTYDWVGGGTATSAKLNFESINVGIMAIYDNFHYKAFVWATTDGGLTWTNTCVVPLTDLGQIWSTGNNQRLLFSNHTGVKVSLTGCFGPLIGLTYPYPITIGVGPILSYAQNNTLYTAGGAGGLGYTPVFKSIDGGQTWAVTPGSPQTTIDFTAITFYNPTSGFIANVQHIFKTSDGGATWAQVYSDKTVTCIAAVEYNCNCPSGFIKNAKNECYNASSKLTYDWLPCPVKLTDCTNSLAEPLYSLSTEISSQINSVVKTQDGDCYFISANSELSVITTEIVPDVYYTGSNPCRECKPVYNVFACGDYSAPVYCTFEDLSAYLNMSVLISVNDNEVDGCYRIGIALDGVCDNPTVIGIRQSYDTCEQCQPVYYVLTSCSNSEIVLVTENVAFNAVVGDVVTLKEHPGLCWHVAKHATPYDNIVNITLDQTYTDCNCCFEYQCKI